jgi:hypothetical protein
MGFNEACSDRFLTVLAVKRDISFPETSASRLLAAARPARQMPLQPVPAAREGLLLGLERSSHLTKFALHHSQMLGSENKRIVN